MNDVSIIINGVRYDAVKAGHCDIYAKCSDCKLFLTTSCIALIGVDRVFKKSTKSFER
jgi:hypothetical protein